MLALRLDSSPGLEKRLARLAKFSKRSKSYIVRTMLEDNIDDMELYYLGEQAYKEWVEDGKKSYSLKKAKKMIHDSNVE